MKKNKSQRPEHNMPTSLAIYCCDEYDGGKMVPNSMVKLSFMETDQVAIYIGADGGMWQVDVPKIKNIMDQKRRENIGKIPEIRKSWYNKEGD